MKQTAILSGIGYNVTVADRQVIFEEAIPIHGCGTSFAFERPIEINDSPGIWYLSNLEAHNGMVPASHIVKAWEWCCEMFGKSFDPYKGELETK